MKQKFEFARSATNDLNFSNHKIVNIYTFSYDDVLFIFIINELINVNIIFCRLKHLNLSLIHIPNLTDRVAMGERSSGTVKTTVGVG